jgi:phosphohistidine phosphatase
MALVQSGEFSPKPGIRYFCSLIREKIMIVYFLRHGLAGDRAEWTGNDGLRPLTEKGISQMEKTADALSILIPDLDVIITSPLVRAQQTAQIVAEKLKMEESLVEDSRLSPGFSYEDLSEILREQAEAVAIILVGHEPDFNKAISDLIGGGRIICKKGGVARVDLTSSDPPQGKLVWLIPPKVLIL